MKQKLLLTINSLRSGGAERVVSLLLNHLQKDFDIHLALYHKEIEYDIPPGINIIDLKQPENDNQLLTLLKLPVLSYRLSRYCKKNNIRHSVAFLNRPCYINALMRNWWGYKGRVVVCERTHQTTMLQTKSWISSSITRMLVKYAYKTADLVLANSEVMKADLQKNFQVHTPIRVIYNPVDMAELTVKMKEPVTQEFEPGIFYFISVGNFRKEKNYPLLIDAFALLKNESCKLILIGGGKQEAQLKIKVQALGLLNQVLFLGRDNNPFKYIQRAGCFVMCSDVEGFPNVLLEALACGKPAISTDCKSGPRELLAPGTDVFMQVTDAYSIEKYGLLTPVADSDALAKAMMKVMKDEMLQERLKRNATARAAEFDITFVKQAFVEAFAGRPSENYTR